MYVCVCVCMYVCMYLCMYACMHVGMLAQAQVVWCGVAPACMLQCRCVTAPAGVCYVGGDCFVDIFRGVWCIALIICKWEITWDRDSDNDFDSFRCVRIFSFASFPHLYNTTSLICLGLRFTFPTISSYIRSTHTRLRTPVQALVRLLRFAECM